jgi:hypothetical protein
VIFTSPDSSPGVVSGWLHPVRDRIIRIRIENKERMGIVFIFMGLKRHSQRGCSIGRSGRTDHGFQHTGQLAAWHHHPPLTTQAFQTDIGA